MKKKLKPMYFIIIIIICIPFAFSYNRGKIQFTEEEKAFIEEHKDTVFFAGYYPTPAERRFSQKLCEKIEEDTSLKIRIHDDTWNNNLSLMKSGSLPIVMNMNRTAEREEYAFFTDTFMPIACGIYSNLDNAIKSYEDINGKVIGGEKEVAILDSFTDEYPKLIYETIIYDTFEDTREAFARGETDGFFSTKSYDENVKGLHFFEIESISQATNHIGVSKDYPELYGIIAKEVDYLKQQNWDTLVSDVINFELEKGFVDFSESELDYIKQKKTIVAGLPTDYFLYVQGEEYNPKGILAEVLTKIEMISGCNIVYRFDSLENLRLRNDIDFYVDSTITKGYASVPIFADDIIIVGPTNEKAINEMHELSPYNVGVFGVMDVVDYLLENMPNINIQKYVDFDLAIKQIKKGELDYIILPKLYFATVQPTKYLLIRGELTSNINRFVSEDLQCVEILNKCLSIIDTDKIIHGEMTTTNNQYKPYLYVGIGVLLIGVLLILSKLYKIIKKAYYMDNKYGLYNVKYLEKQLKGRDVHLVLVEINNADDILWHYRNKIYDKYISNFIEGVKKDLLDTEYIAFIDTNRFLIVKDYDTHIVDFCDMLTGSENVIINKVKFTYNLSICYLDCLKEEVIKKSIDKLYTGIKMVKGKNEVVYFNKQMQDMYKNRIAKDIHITHAINRNNIKLFYKDIVSEKGKVLGKYVSVGIDNMAYTVLYKRMRELNLETKLDKVVLKSILTERHNQHSNVFLNISECTLTSSNFFEWLDSILDNNTVTLYFLINFDAYDRNIDILERNRNVNYVFSSFGNDLKTDCFSKYYDIEYLLLDFSLLEDIEANEEIIAFIKEFAKKYNKKIISKTQQLTVADYYIKDDYNENTYCGRQ